MTYRRLLIDTVKILDKAQKTLLRRTRVAGIDIAGNEVDIHRPCRGLGDGFACSLGLCEKIHD